MARAGEPGKAALHVDLCRRDLHEERGVPRVPGGVHLIRVLRLHRAVVRAPTLSKGRRLPDARGPYDARHLIEPMRSAE